MFKHFVSGLCTIWASTVMLLSIFSYVGVRTFFVPGIFHAATLGLFLSLVAFILFFLLSLATWGIFNKVQEPGWVIPSLLGVTAGTITIWLTAQLVPNAITLVDFWTAPFFSVLNTALIWGITFVTSSKSEAPSPWPGS